MIYEIWTGDVDRLPVEYPTPECFATPTLAWQGKVATIDLFGLLDQRGWINAALLVREAAGADEIRFRISSRAQCVHAAGVILVAVEAARLDQRITAEVFDAGGMALLLAESCESVTWDHGYKEGAITTRAMFGCTNYELAAHVGKLLETMLEQCRAEPDKIQFFPRLAANAAQEKILSQGEVQQALRVLNDFPGVAK